MKENEKYTNAIEGQEENYSDKLQYLIEKNRALVVFEFCAKEFEENPWTGNYTALEIAMMRYQNICYNCAYKED